MHFIFDTDEAFSFETLRAVAYTPYGGADIGEVVTTARRIPPGDVESWYREWRGLADRIAGIAERCAADGHTVSASGAYLRASNYYRTAEFFLRDEPWNDPRVAETSARAIETFRAAPVVQEQWQRVRIPYEGTHLEGYFLNVGGDEPGPTLLAHGGYDSTVEELYFSVGEAARRYGWNCLIFEGPGQGSALRKRGLTFRFDWEAVVTPVVDFALGLRGVDAKRLALLGMSMGGYLAPRAVAFEPRIAACVAYDGVLRLAAALDGLRSPGADAEQWLEQFDRAMAQRATATSGQRWMLSNARWVFGSGDSRELLQEFERYDLSDVADRITCPTLVCAAEADQFFQGQPRALYDALRCPKTLIEFTSAEGAGEHCHEGALTLFHQRMFDWLDDTVAECAVAERTTLEGASR